MMELNNADKQQLAQRGISLTELERQVRLFKEGTRPIPLNKACTTNDGIIETSDHSRRELEDYFDEQAKSKVLVKFVPASGAASRMFKHLHNSESEDSLFVEFKNQLTSFPFFVELRAVIEGNGESLEELVDSSNWQAVVDYILEERGLGYGTAPKGMVLFHDYGDGQRTAFEEQLFEGLGYAGSRDDVNIHFTVPLNSRNAIQEYIESCIGQNNAWKVSYSIQEPFSDTVAVDLENVPIRDDQGALVFRPGGHGALIHNLNKIEADIIFIKNIDNVAPDRLKPDTFSYKKVLAGLAMRLTETRNRIFDNEDSGDATEFIRMYFDPAFDGDLSQARLLLDRPIRVCGMVKNTGEPGGGPFWVKKENGRLSCQIVEKAQVDLDDPEQANILAQATHFNPVDLICSVMAPDGSKYDLLKYLDPGTSFISEKSLGGKKLKALELPGLWNGAMALWNTVFVEVPISTFSPVKTVNDLLRPEHRAMEN